jgi:hypothetical protein
LPITADAGGSNAYRSRVFKTDLQAFADRIGLTIAGLSIKRLSAGSRSDQRQRSCVDGS